MRIWTIHPKYLDAKGLVALWRETLLAQKVLRGLTKGYTNHPQLQRFKELSDPVGAVADYLRIVQQEAVNRGYNFDAGRIVQESWGGMIQETEGQVLYEWQHFLRKTQTRTPDHYEAIKEVPMPELHPMFELIDGEIRDWERV
ncbi:pyrimidine dimer DNA glycosylase/endonuclease V [Magnetococcus sp. PR-3]|uniref:pyrimidine dimer DNA glycosylase/endonuclease V n=1 Tax=Magnetococcus sp. PR-3 TaxID=3120355 RepID=UPI002FCE0338